MPSQAESRPTTPHQKLQVEGDNRVGAGPQPQPRIPTDNANIFIEASVPATLTATNDGRNLSAKKRQNKGERKSA